jgi:hypothetical protein
MKSTMAVLTVLTLTLAAAPVLSLAADPGTSGGSSGKSHHGHHHGKKSSSGTTTGGGTSK